MWGEHGINMFFQSKQVLLKPYNFIDDILQQISQTVKFQSFRQQTNLEKVKKEKNRRTQSKTIWSLHLDVVSSLLSKLPGHLFPLPSLSITLSSFLSLFFLNDGQRGTISCFVTNSSIHNLLPSVIGSGLPWRWHWLWVLEVGHHDCWDGQPADSTENGSKHHVVWELWTSCYHYSMNFLFRPILGWAVTHKHNP